MTIESIGDKIIDLIRTFPDEARQSQADSGPLTSWDEYKEQIQYEEYDSFEIFQYTIESLVTADVSEISDEDIITIYNQGYKSRYPLNLSEMRDTVRSRVLSYIDQEASDQEIEYRKPVIEFIRYFVEDLMIVAHVLKQVGPESYLIQAYSEATGPDGEQGEADLSTLDEENDMERIYVEEFEREKWILTELNKNDEELTEIQKAIKKIDFRLQQSWLHEKPDKNRFDYELFLSGIILSRYHVEAGAKKFNEYVWAMIKDLGYAIKPYLKYFYGALRDMPEFDSAGMDSKENIYSCDIDNLLVDPRT